MAYNVLAAKRAGATDEQIARIIAEDLGQNYDELVASGATANQIIKIGTEEDLSFGEAFSRGFSAEVGSEIAGAAQLAGFEPTDETVAKEQEARVSGETNPIATGLGRFVGGLINPSSLIPGAVLFKGAKGVAAAGALGGGASGFLRPIYDEEDMGRGASTALGAVGGAAIGGVLGKLFGKSLTKQADEVVDGTQGTAGKVEPSTSAETLTKTEVESPFTEDELTRLLDIQQRIQTGELVTQAEQRFLRDFEDKLPPLSDDARRAFEIQGRINSGELVTPAEQRFVMDFMKNDKPVFEVKATGKAVDEVTPEVQAAKVEGTAGQAGPDVAMAASEQAAFKSGDYRDFLRTSATRFASITPKQFARMIDPTNPFKNENIKVLLSKNENDVEVLEQIYGALNGRFNYERQSGKSFSEIAEDFVPEQVAIEALLNRKVQEILPPEVTGAAVKAASKAVADLHNAQELARVAKEMGSDEAYAVLQAQMSQASALLASLEGNSSNLGRALAYQKQLKELIDANRQLPNYLGGFKC